VGKAEAKKLVWEKGVCGLFLCVLGIACVVAAALGYSLVAGVFPPLLGAGLMSLIWGALLSSRIEAFDEPVAPSDRGARGGDGGGD
jgi:CHASE2 domain-containing sensor protein